MALQTTTPSRHLPVPAHGYANQPEQREGSPVYLILDNLSTHHAPDVLLFAARHPTWTLVYQPVYAAWLNLIEPWWKTLRSLALKGRRFDTWDAICDAVREATAYWNAHKHPFVWGRRRRHRHRRKPGIALGANVRPLSGCTT